MKKILITSYFAGIERQFSKFINDNNIEIQEILFISTAGNVEEYRQYIDEGIHFFKSSGYKLNFLDIANESKEKCATEIKNAQLIYISGGNTFYLLQEIKKKELISVLREKISSGCPYIGESAGGIILSKTIEYVKEMDDAKVAPELKELNALDVIDFYPLPHYMEEPFSDIVQKIAKEYTNRINLVPINNNQAIVVVNDSIKIE
ncbi:Type 1 glutamine amidotransferase-like domain-containing protein [Enterococcus sp. LJL99]